MKLKELRKFKFRKQENRIKNKKIGRKLTARITIIKLLKSMGIGKNKNIENIWNKTSGRSRCANYKTVLHGYNDWHQYKLSK